MRKKISFWFLSGLVIWGFIVVLRKNGIYIPLISNYFTDFITVPMYCYLIEYIMREIGSYSWKPDLKFVVTSWVYLSFLFEVLCPALSDLFTADILDVLAYFLGGAGYYFWIVKGKRKVPVY